MKYDRLWERLFEYVNEWARAREVLGGIQVTFNTAPGATRTVEVVVTPAEWDDYISTIYGAGDPRVTSFKQQVLATPDTCRYLVYDGAYDWQASKKRELPGDHLNPEPGQWVVRSAEGNITEGFADFNGN